MDARDPRRINTLRGIVTWFIRAAAVLLLVIGSYLVLKRLVFAATTLDLSSAVTVYEGVGEGHSASRGLAMIAVAVVLAWWSRSIAAWIITLAPTGCPRCGYAVEGAGPASKCPECGLHLPAAHTPPGGARPGQDAGP